MGIALLTTARLLASAQHLVRECAGAASRRLSLCAAWASRQLPMAAPPDALRVRQAQALAHTAVPTPRPLRVVRVLEGAEGSRSMGRMVISGRLADVCAELDRLAACEGLGL